MQTTDISQNPWFYELKGQRTGPISEAEAVQLIKAGTLSYGSLVWQPGSNDWQALENSALRSHLTTTTPPPLTGQGVNNSLVWVLAFAPLLGYLLEWFIAGAVHGSEYKAQRAMEEGGYWYVTLLLNILLSLLDERRLKNAGHNTQQFKGWVWLVPVYLYQRAKHLKHNLAYFIVWLSCFVLVLLTSAGV